MAVPARNLRLAAPVLPSAVRSSPAAPSSSTLNPVQRGLIDLQRSAGNRAVSLVVQREPGADTGFKIISEVWQVGGRDIVVVATGHGDQVLFFYRRTGLGYKGAGVAPKAGSWTPFKTLMSQDASIIGKELEIVSTKESVRLADRNYVNPRTKKIQVANPKKAWFNKQPHYSQVHPDDPLRGMSNTRNQAVSQWLEKENVPAGQVKHWETVEQEMDNVANRYRAQARMKGKPTHVGARHGPIAGPETPHGPEGGGSGGGGAKAGTEAGATEAKGAGLEAKAAGVEAKALGTEAKLIGAEVTGAMKAESVLTKGARIAGAVSKAARVSELLIALGMPGPQDVLFMFISAFASIAEAKAKLRASGFATGFAQGIAAVITWTDPEEAARKLAYKVADPEMGERVVGFEGTREQGTNDGLKAGWKFGSALNGEQRKGFRGMALEATGIRLKRHYNRDELIEIGGVLRPTVVALLAEAARQEQAKEDKAKAEAYARGIAARRR